MSEQLYSFKQLGVMYEAYLADNATNHIPVVLEDAAGHIMGMKGKRIRPLLLLESCQLFGGDVTKAMPIALVIEVFHNFSLVHDDIIDQADLRRGVPAVHTKYGVNKAILTGDAMLLSTFITLSENAPQVLPQLIDVYSRAAMQVVDGEQEDVDFEDRDEVSMAEYMRMISYKTSVLLAASLQMGAILANASAEDQQNMYDFGLNLGLAFQIKDDYLDAYGDPDKFGKKVGGDILLNKKTYLSIKALEVADSRSHEQIMHIFRMTPSDEKIKDMLALYDTLGIKQYTYDEMDALYNKAKLSLEHTSLSKEDKSHLAELADHIYHRDF
jgi:geranylgeranyl diphosphate synthase type II